MGTEEIVRLEAKCYYKCPDAEELYRFACWLAENWAGSRDAPERPDPGRRWMVNSWTYTGRGEPWKNAYLHGLSQAFGVVNGAQQAGIDVHLVAVRVQPEDCELPPDAQLVDVRPKVGSHVQW